MKSALMLAMVSLYHVCACSSGPVATEAPPDAGVIECDKGDACNYAGSYAFCFDGKNVCEACICEFARCTVADIASPDVAAVGTCVKNADPSGPSYVCSVPCGQPASGLCK